MFKGVYATKGDFCNLFLLGFGVMLGSYSSARFPKIGFWALGQSILFFFYRTGDISSSSNYILLENI